MKHSDRDFKYFVGYKEGKIVKPLCIILLQMTGYIKYFENGGKNMSFIIEDDVLAKHNKTWDKIIETLSIKFHSMPASNEKYMKAKVREFMIKSNFLGDKIPKESMHLHACTMRMEKEKLSAGLFRMQVQNEKDKDDQILKS